MSFHFLISKGMPLEIIRVVLRTFIFIKFVGLYKCFLNAFKIKKNVHRDPTFIFTELLENF